MGHMRAAGGQEVHALLGHAALLPWLGPCPSTRSRPEAHVPGQGSPTGNKGMGMCPDRAPLGKEGGLMEEERQYA